MGNVFKMDKTKIQISTGTWLRLNGLKKPGESFDEVIRRMRIQREESIRPRIIGRFSKGEEGRCSECQGAFPLEEMGFVAKKLGTGRAQTVEENVFGFDLYCYDCFDAISDGDDKSWREAESQ